MSETTTITAEERRTYLALWAAKHGVALELEGKCGIGRECVGFTKGSGYLDYSHLWDDDTDEATGFFTPADAYHKHACMAVLGRGEDAERQLFEWAKWLDDNGWTVETVSRKPSSQVDAMLSGFTTSRLVKVGG